MGTNKIKKERKNLKKKGERKEKNNRYEDQRPVLCYLKPLVHTCQIARCVIHKTTV
jgi:hypothetical protein